MEKISNQSAEILNSVEDMKQLASSVPNGLHDLLPKIDKIGAEVRVSVDLDLALFDLNWPIHSVWIIRVTLSESPMSS